MFLVSRASKLKGRTTIPASKSHTIRAVAISALAEGKSVIEAPLDSLDTLAAVRAYRAFGAGIDLATGRWEVQGVAGKPRTPKGEVDTANSGTTLYVAMGSAALADGRTVLTGDEQIQRRPVTNLSRALEQLGAKAVSTRGNGCPPVEVRGVIRGGEASIEAITSQYVTSVLLAAPLGQGKTRLTVTKLNEAPYVRMTLGWLAKQGIVLAHDEDLRKFEVSGGQRYKPVRARVPADWSSATFFLVAAAVTGSEITLTGLDPDDSQGDKAVAGMLAEMGAEVKHGKDGLTIRCRGLVGRELDLNATPDALPALAVAGCFARGETRLVNVPQARVKETDRIAVMREELTKMGAEVEEREDGLVVRESRLAGTQLNGHGDHRVVMALAVAGLAAEGETRIDTAESVAVTFPSFVELMRALGGEMGTEG
ncbi:MAG: 3-phosphoshikimate 1-carboxyvinyltransferase [Planctomycetota bacterium]